MLRKIGQPMLTKIDRQLFHIIATDARLAGANQQMFLTYTIDYVTPDRFFCLRFNCQYTHYCGNSRNCTTLSRFLGPALALSPTYNPTLALSPTYNPALAPCPQYSPSLAPNNSVLHLKDSKHANQTGSRIATPTLALSPTYNPALAPCPPHSPALAPTTRFFISRTPDRK